MRTLINKTNVYCDHCGEVHEADIHRDAQRIIGSIDCPEGQRNTLLSDDAEQFCRIREESGFDEHFVPPKERFHILSYVSVTDDCNCACPICYSNSLKQETNFYLSLADAEKIAKQSIACGAGIIVLVGGEPTLHPDLEGIIRILKKTGNEIWMATNGLTIARKPDLAKRLKKAGLSKVCLQLDTLVPETHQLMRGHRLIEEKKQCAANTYAAKMKLGIVCTVSTHNIDEIAEMVKWALNLPIPPHSIALQVASVAGRHAIEQTENVITRELIMRKLCAGKVVSGMEPRHFHPYPLFRPKDIYVHPDCAASAFVLTRENRSILLDELVDLPSLMKRAIATRFRCGRRTRHWILPLLAIASLKRSSVPVLFNQLIARLINRKSRHHFTLIGTGGFLCKQFQDTQKIERCASVILCTDHYESICNFYRKELTRADARARNHQMI